MSTLLARWRAMEQRPGVALILGLGGSLVVLFLVGVLGLIAVDDPDGSGTALVAGEGDSATTTVPTDGVTDTTVAGTTETTTLTPGGAAPGPGSPAPGSPGAPRQTSPTPGSPGTTQPPSPTATLPSQPGATRIGVSAAEIKWAVHAPKTFDGAPLNLAEDPIEGLNYYVRYVNANGGINGRKIKLRPDNDGIFDDRYTVEGAKGAANQINEFQPFFVSGTLGVDQIAVIADEAKKRGYPYLAAGGSEGPFRNIGMFQVAASYDTHLTKLAELLGKEVANPSSFYFGRKRIGVTMLRSPYIEPSVENFRAALQANGLELVAVVKIEKPTEQTSYGNQIADLKGSTAQIVVPAQDPISTSRMVAECVTQQCPWRWAVSNFAHESDTALSLMGGTWSGVKGLAGGCYYLHENANDPSKCAALGRARTEWVAMDPDKESGFEKDGQGGVAGYQLVHIWLTALRSVGDDPTREKFLAALHAQENFTDLVSAPITYKGSPNLAHGAEQFVVYEAQTNLKWKQLTPGFVSSF